MAIGNSKATLQLLTRLDPNAKEKLSAAEAENIVQQLSMQEDFRIQNQLQLLFSSYLIVRNTALSLVLAAKDERLVDSILKQCLGQNADQRLECLKCCHQISPQRTRNATGPLLASKELSKREIALDIVQSASNYLEFLSFTKAALRDTSAKIRHRAVRILGPFADNETVFLMLRARINDADEIMRFLVIEALSKNPKPEAVEIFFERLPSESMDTKSVIMGALKRLAKSNPKAISKRLLPVLADQDRAMRDIAVKLLAELPDQTEVLRNFLAYSKGLAFWLRERCFRSLEKMSHDFVPALITLLNDSDGDIRVNALGMVSKLNDPRLQPAVQKILSSNEDWWVRSMAAEFLAQFQDPQVEAQLISYLDNSDLRYSVLAILGKSKSEEATNALAKYLTDSSDGIRRACMQSLAKQATEASLELLGRSCMRETVDEVQAFALELLRSHNSCDEKVQQIEFSLKKKHSKAQSEVAEELLELDMENESLNQF